MVHIAAVGCPLLCTSTSSGSLRVITLVQWCYSTCPADTKTFFLWWAPHSVQPGGSGFTTKDPETREHTLLFLLFNFFTDGTKVLREAFIGKVHLRNLRIVRGIKTNKGRNKKNRLLPSSKITNQKNKENHCEKYCLCFYSANAGLLLTGRNVAREGE